MKINKIVENEDGSAEVDVTFTNEELTVIIEHFLVTGIEKFINEKYSDDSGNNADSD